MIWDRFVECYGSAEEIGHALFKRLDNFPKIPNKVYQKLRELNDLLIILQVPKAKGDLPSLTQPEVSTPLYKSYPITYKSSGSYMAPNIKGSIMFHSPFLCFCGLCKPAS